MKKYLIAVVSLCIAALFAAETDNVVFYDTILASVNGKPIVLSEVVMESQFAESKLFATLSGDELENAIVAQRRKVTDQIINRILIQKEFKVDEYKIDNQVVESALDDWAAGLNCSNRVELQRWAHRNRTSIPEMRRQVLERLIEQYILYRQFAITVNATPKDIYEYYQAHMAEFSRPERIKLRIMMLAANRNDYKEIVPEIRRRLAENPAQFAEFTATYSDGPFRRVSDPGFIERTDLREIFAAALGEQPQVGRVYGPVITPEGTYFLYPEELIAAEEPPLADLQETIKERIESEARAKALNVYIEKLRAKAIIRYY